MSDADKPKYPAPASIDFGGLANRRLFPAENNPVPEDNPTIISIETKWIRCQTLNLPSFDIAARTEKTVDSGPPSLDDDFVKPSWMQC